MTACDMKIMPKIKNWILYGIRLENKNPGKKLKKNRLTLGLLRFIISPVIKNCFFASFLELTIEFSFKVKNRRIAKNIKQEAPTNSIALIIKGNVSIKVARPKTTKKVCAINPEHKPKLTLIPHLRP